MAAQHATEPLLVIDRDRVRFANQAFANLVGVPLLDLDGKDIDQLVTILDEPLVVERLRNAVRQDQPFRGEATCHTASGGFDTALVAPGAGLGCLQQPSGRRNRHLDGTRWRLGWRDLGDGFIRLGLHDHPPGPDPGAAAISGDDSTRYRHLHRDGAVSSGRIVFQTVAATNS